MQDQTLFELLGGNEQLAKDQELYEQLRRSGFSGPLFEHLKQELWRYGWQALCAWMRDGKIVEKCADNGIRIFPQETEAQVLRRSPEVRDALAGEAVEAAIERFMLIVLPQGKWDPKKKAAMRTYFVRGCLYAFRDAFRAWAHKRRRELKATADNFALDPHSRGELSVEDLAVMRDTANRILRHASDDAKAICARIYQSNCTREDIAQELNMSLKSVEGHMRRLRQKAKDLVKSGEIDITGTTAAIAQGHR